MCLLRIYRASVGRYTRCGYCQERTSSHWRDDAKPFSRVASFQGTPVHKDSAVTAPTAQSANRIYAIADSFLAPAIAFQTPGLPNDSMRPKGRRLPCGHAGEWPLSLLPHRRFRPKAEARPTSDLIALEAAFIRSVVIPRFVPTDV